jgi:hypothetical protein
MAIDRFMPRWDVADQHSIEIAAPPQRVDDALRGLRLRDSPIFMVLMGMRSMPYVLSGLAKGTAVADPVLQAALRAGFVELADEPGTSLVFGAIGRFWRPISELIAFDPEEFADFSSPGLAKAAIEFAFEEQNGHTVLTTETRIVGTDESSSRLFRRYWLLVGWGSAAIRRSWLKAVKAKAESS